jgi:hypothetical protein
MATVKLIFRCNGGGEVGSDTSGSFLGVEGCSALHVAAVISSAAGVTVWVVTTSDVTSGGTSNAGVIVWVLTTSGEGVTVGGNEVLNRLCTRPILVR